jgi:hypothetical protein
MKKKLLSQKTLSQFLFSLGLFLLCVNLGWGQNPAVTGDVVTDGDYRSAASGSWSDVATWQVRTGLNAWVAASVAPTSLTTVYIQAAHTVTLAGESNCYSLHIATTGVLTAGENTVNVYGKLRCYVLTPAAISLTSDNNAATTPAVYYGADALPTTTAMITATAGFTTLRFRGATRAFNFTAEWGSGGTTPVISADIDLDAGATITSGVAMKFSNLTLTTGQLTYGQAHIITGNCTIKTGAKILTTRDGAGTNVSIGNFNGTAAGTLDIQAGGTLEFRSVSPDINFAAFVNNGTVTYSTVGTPVAGNFMTNNDTTIANPDVNTYTNLTISNPLGVTATASIKSITGVLNVTAGSILNAGGFVTLKSTATKSATIWPLTTGVINGNVTVERYIPAGFRQYRLLSPATTGGTINANWQENQADGVDGNPGYGTHLTGAGGAANGFDTTINNAASIFTHTSTVAPAAWTAVANTSGTLTAGSPYLVYIRGSRLATNIDGTATNDATTLRTTGTVTTGTKVVSGLNATADGFSLIGNPYQAQVDMSAVLGAATDLVTGFYYVLNPANGAYSTFDFSLNTGTSGNANKYLQPGQACFVKTVAAPSATPTLSFNEVNKNTAGAQTAVFRTNQLANMLRLSLYDTAKPAEAVDGLIVAFDSNESNAVNDNDANKLTNFNESMATANSGTLLAIEKRAIPATTDEIPLNIKQYRGTSYSLKVQGSGLTETPYLVDRYAGTTTEIPVDGTINYAYTVDAGNAATTDASRFKLIYAKTLKTIDNTIAGFTLYPNPSKSNSFSVVVPQSLNKASLTVSNLLGQKLYSQNDLQSGTAVKVNVSNVKTAGVYLVSLTSEGKTVTTKWIVE